MSESVGDNPNTPEHETDAIETLIRGYVKAIELRETRVSQLAAEQREENPSPELIAYHKRLIRDSDGVIEDSLSAIALVDREIYEKITRYEELGQAA